MIDWESTVQSTLEAANDPESHVERDPNTFHPSQISMCRRRAYCGKLGLDDNSEILGIFRTGTLIHEFLEEHLSELHPHLELETSVELAVSRLRFVGQADVFDPETATVYDFKTRSSWYNFDPPNDRHLDQLHVYMAAKRAAYGQIVYLSKSDMEVRTYPEDRRFCFDDNRWSDIVERAQDIKQAIEEHGVAESADEIPFDPCGCYFCENETLSIPTRTPAQTDD